MHVQYRTEKKPSGLTDESHPLDSRRRTIETEDIAAWFPPNVD